MLDVLGQHALEGGVEPLHVGVGQIAAAAARFHQEQRVGVERAGVEVVGVLLRQLLHGVGVGAVLVAAFGRIEVLHVAHGQGVDERAFLRRGRGAHRHGLLRGGVSEGRLLGDHRAVQIRAPRPGFAPVADGAARVALPRLAERAHRIELGERIHHLEALVEERLGFVVGGGDLAGEGAEAHRIERNRVGYVFRKRQRIGLRARGRGRRAHRHVVLRQRRCHRHQPHARCEHGHSNTTTRTPHGILPGPATRGPGEIIAERHLIDAETTPASERLQFLHWLEMSP